MWFDEKYKNGIAIKNFSCGFNDSEKRDIEHKLQEYDIGLLFFDSRGLENSVFDLVSIYINNNLLELIITGLLAPAAYDILKRLASAVAKRLHQHICKEKQDESCVSFKMKVGEKEIIAPIPYGLDDVQFTKYMDMLKDAICTVNDTYREDKKFEYFIIQYDNGKVKVMSVYEYAMCRKNSVQVDGGKK